MSSGGISVVSGTLPAAATAVSGEAAVVSLVEALSPHPVKSSALELRAKSVIFFIGLYVFIQKFIFS
jgi:hypothetical protein